MFRNSHKPLGTYWVGNPRDGHPALGSHERRARWQAPQTSTGQAGPTRKSASEADVRNHPSRTQSGTGHRERPGRDGSMSRPAKTRSLFIEM
jgi:hypothetical protein